MNTRTKYGITAVFLSCLIGLAAAQGIPLNMTVVPQGQGVMNYTMPSGQVVYYGYASSSAAVYGQTPLSNQTQVWDVPLSATIKLGAQEANSYYVMPSGTPVFYWISGV
jgi:hypothetical protein